MTVTGAPRQFVKVVFIKLQDDEIYSGGEPDKNLVRVVGAIRAGRDTSDKQLILKGINDVIKATASASLVEIRELEVGDEGGGVRLKSQETLTLRVSLY